MADRRFHRHIKTQRKKHFRLGKRQKAESIYLMLQIFWVFVKILLHSLPSFIPFPHNYTFFIEFMTTKRLQVCKSFLLNFYDYCYLNMCVSRRAVWFAPRLISREIICFYWHFQAHKKLIFLCQISRFQTIVNRNFYQIIATIIGEFSNVIAI